MSDKTHSECEWTLDRIEPFLDGELSCAEVGQLEGHTAFCDSCMSELDEARIVLAALRGLPEVRCPDAVLEGAMREVETLAGSRSYSGWLGLAAAALLLLTAGVALMRGPGNRTAPSDVVEIQASQRDILVAMAGLELARRKSTAIFEAQMTDVLSDWRAGQAQRQEALGAILLKAARRTGEAFTQREDDGKRNVLVMQNALLRNKSVASAVEVVESMGAFRAQWVN